jgi:predicted N-formylglutamate amidohydrolase
METSEHLPPPATVHNADASSPYILLCEHASRFIPASYEGLGLSEAELTRHIAWDIGAAEVAKATAVRLGAPLVSAGYSRLLIDLNRPLGSPTSIPEISESTVIPGNQNLGEAERCRRIASYFEPFQAAVSRVIEARLDAGRGPIIIGIHSFTPVYKGVRRPWQAGILYRKATTFGHGLAEALGGAAREIAENEPYQIEDDGDYTVPVHGEARGLDAVLVEIRQDLIADSAGAASWAKRLAIALASLKE